MTGLEIAVTTSVFISIVFAFLTWHWLLKWKKQLRTLENELRQVERDLDHKIAVWAEFNDELQRGFTTWKWTPKN